MTPKDAFDDSVSAHLSKVLSHHGHGFHYAVLRRAAELREQRKSRWTFQAAEFAVSVNDDPTHVDFVLKSDPGRTYLIAECKRADPARALWCFVRAPYTWLGASGNEIVLEEIEVVSDVVFQPKVHVVPSQRGCYQIGWELKTGAVGDGAPGGRAIADATAQVLRGMNGVVGHLFGPSRVAHDRGRTWFLPAIFTTAELWTSSTDLRETDLKTGRVQVSDAMRVEWLWYTHNQSPAIRHRLNRNVGLRDLSTDLYRESARTIAIVSAEGIDQFLSADLESYFG